MRALFTNRGIALVLFLFFAFVGLSGPLKEVAQMLRSAKIEQELGDGLNLLNQLPPQIINMVLAAAPGLRHIRLPGVSVEIDANPLFIVVGVIMVLAGMILHVRAIKSEAFFDDFVALVLDYVLLQVGTGLWVGAGFIPAPFRVGLLAVLLTVIVLGVTWRSGGKDDSRIFFRGLLQVVLIFLFLFPRQTLNAAISFLEWTGNLGADAQLPIWFPIVAVVGLLVALPLLYGIGIKPKKQGPSVDDVKRRVDEVLDDMKQPAK